MGTIITVLVVALATWLIAHVVHRRRTHARFKMRTWIAALLAAVLTAFAGILMVNLSSPDKQIAHDVNSSYGVDDPQFDRVMGNLLGPTLVNGNRIQTLVNGDEFFPAMLHDIRHAKKTLTFEMFVYWKGETGRVFADAVSERARAGVRCHVLLDYVGSKKMDKKLIEQMKAAGAEVEIYHPLSWYTIDRINNRTHRKIIVVDGVIGYTGGAGIGDEWTGDAQDANHWRDSHFRFEGPVVGQLQTAFMDNWLKTKSEVLHDVTYFPRIDWITSVSLNTTAALATAPQTSGTALITEVRAQSFKSSSEDGSENARLMFLLAVACARKSILIENSYFVPDDICVDALVKALKRGVTVEILVPGPITDEKLVRQAGRSLYDKLLLAGAKIYEYRPTFMHAKVLVIDGFFSSVGSVNLDERAFHLNDENNVNVYDREFARQQEEIIREDIKRGGKQYTLEQWRNRTWKDKLKERYARMFRTQL
ncbi:MAG: phospholipase D-like domain-containing protein [Candidatus Sumerlaeaceae bacterium]